MISETTIQKVRELAIEDVLSPYVRLSRKGSTLMGLCPFHTEKTGSFAVTPGKNLFHCFSWNRGGGSITFIMEKENVTRKGFSSMMEISWKEAKKGRESSMMHRPGRCFTKEIL